MTLLQRFFMFSLLALPALSVQADPVDDFSLDPSSFIEHEAQETLFLALGLDGTQAQQRAVETVLANSHKHNPVALYLTARALFNMGRKDEAALWFYSAQLRAVFDAKRCADSSARQAILILNDRFGPPINYYAFQDLEKLQRTVQQAVDWDFTTAHHYDPNWIAHHGIGVMDPNTVGREGWAALAQETRVDYLNSFLETIAVAAGDERIRQLLKHKAPLYELNTGEPNAEDEEVDDNGSGSYNDLG